MPKPKIFVSFSEKGKSYGRVLQASLSDIASVSLRGPGVMRIGNSILSELALVEADFAIFIFHSDDKGNLRSNIVFEIGLFMGKLGVDKVFVVTPSNRPKFLPEYLSGICTGYYDISQENLHAAFGPFSADISDRIQNFNGVFTTIQNKAEPNPVIVAHQAGYTSKHSNSYFIKKSKNRLETIYEVTILNKEGDAKIKKTDTFEAWEDVSELEHEFFSDVSAMKSTDMDLKSFDANNNELETRFTSDFANRKKFKIFFGRTLLEKSVNTYSYEFKWHSLFPNLEEYFFLLKGAETVKFILNVPSVCTLSPLWLEQVDGERRLTKIADGLVQNHVVETIPGYTSVSYDISPSIQIDSSIQIKWMHNLNALKNFKPTASDDAKFLG